MSTYLMFGEYPIDAVKSVSAKRTEQAKTLIEQNGGEYKGGYALLGEIDLVLIVDLPDTESAMKTSKDLSRKTGISFTTAPAVSVAEFDKLMR